MLDDTFDIVSSAAQIIIDVDCLSTVDCERSLAVNIEPWVHAESMLQTSPEPSVEHASAEGSRICSSLSLDRYILSRTWAIGWAVDWAFARVVSYWATLEPMYSIHMVWPWIPFKNRTLWLHAVWILCDLGNENTNIWLAWCFKIDSNSWTITKCIRTCLKDHIYKSQTFIGQNSFLNCFIISYGSTRN